METAPAEECKRQASLDRHQRKLRPHTPIVCFQTPKPSPAVSKRKHKSKDKSGSHPVPKRPRSSFVYFCGDFLANLDVESKVLPITERMRLAGQKWRELTQEAKQQYQAIAQQDSKR